MPNGILRFTTFWEVYSFYFCEIVILTMENTLITHVAIGSLSAVINNIDQWHLGNSAGQQLWIDKQFCDNTLTRQ